MYTFLKKDVVEKTREFCKSDELRNRDIDMGAYCPLAGAIIFKKDMRGAVDAANDSWWCCGDRS